MLVRKNKKFGINKKWKRPKHNVNNLQLKQMFNLSLFMFKMCKD